jgi:hypothetical protein
MDAGIIELEVLFKGRFSDLGLPGCPAFEGIQKNQFENRKHYSGVEGR